MHHFAIRIAKYPILKSISVVYRNVNYQHFFMAIGLSTEDVPLDNDSNA